MAQISLTALDVAYTQDFDTLSLIGGGGSTHDLSIPGWLLGESGGNADGKYTADDGHSPTGESYSYGTTGSSERALGTLQSVSLIPTFGAGFVNDTGAAITSLDVAYVGEEWRLGAAGRTDSLTFEYSLDATDLNSGTWTSVHGLDFSTTNSSGTAGARDGNASGFHTSIAATISGLNIAAGATVFVRWSDTNVSSNDDGLAVDNFSLTPHGGDTTAPTVGVEQAGPQADPTSAAFILFSVTFSEDVTGFDASDIDLSSSTAGGTLTANLIAGPTPNVYTVAVSGMTSSGTVVARINAAAVTDLAGNANAASTSTDNSVAFVWLAGPDVDDVVVSGTGIAAGTGDLNAGHEVTFTVNMSGAVFVAGTPTLALNDGGIATYTGGSGTDALTFQYTVAPGQNTPDLAITGIDLHGATVIDGHGHAASLAGAITNPAGTLQIDTSAPAAPTIALLHDTGFSFTDHVTSDPTLVVTAAESGGTLLYKVDGAANFSSAVPSFATDGSADGFHTVLVEQMDGAGNIGPAASFGFTLEAAPYYGPPRWAGWGEGPTTDFRPPINTGGVPVFNHEGPAHYDRFVTATLGESFKLVFDHFENAAVTPTPFLTLLDFLLHDPVVADFAGDLAHPDHVAASFGESFIHGVDRSHSDYAFHP